VQGLGDESDWPALLNDYEAAVKNFESVSAALTAALSAQYPLDADFLDLMAAEERCRETVILARMRLINLWRESLDGAHPLRLNELPGRTKPP
jgi:hypothetical protein